MNKVDCGINHAGIEINHPESKELVIPSAITVLKKDDNKSIQNNETFRNLQIIRNLKTQKHRIYFNKNGNVKLRLQKNWFIELFRTLLLINFFIYRVKGFNSNQKNVFQNLNKLIIQIKNIQVNNDDISILQKTLKDVHETSLEILRKKYIKDPFKNEAYLSLQNKIKSLVFNKIITSPQEIEQTPKNIENSDEPVTYTEEVKMEDVLLPRLPDLEEYTLPVLVINENKIKELFQKAQTFYQIRTTNIENIQDYLNKYKESKIIFDRIEKEFKKLDVDTPPTVVINLGQPLGPNFAPPPPPIKKPLNTKTGISSNSSIPVPPPPPPTAAAKTNEPKLSWKDKQKNLLENITISKESELMEEYLEAKTTLKDSYNEIFKIVFPNLKLIQVGIEELIPYINKYLELAEKDVELLNKQIEELDPRKLAQKKQAERKLQGNVVKNEFEGLDASEIEKIKKLRVLTKEMVTRIQSLEKNHNKKKELEIDKNKLINDRNKLASELRKIRNEDNSEVKEKEYRKLSKIINAKLSAEVDRNIENLNKNIEKSKVELAKLLQIESENTDALIATAEREIENLFSNFCVR